MGNVGRNYGGVTYTIWMALLTVTLDIPSHLYELLPIAVLIGSIFVMARFAQSSNSPSCGPAVWGPGWRCAPCSPSVPALWC